MLEKAGVRVEKGPFGHQFICMVGDGQHLGPKLLQLDGEQTTDAERDSDTDFVVSAINEALRKRELMDQIRYGKFRTVDVPE